MCMNRNVFGVSCDGQSSLFEAIEVLPHICIFLHRRSASLMNALMADYSYAFDLHSRALIYSTRNCSLETCTACCQILEVTETKNSILQL
jgi:hypothetical protein